MKPMVCPSERGQHRVRQGRQRRPRTLGRPPTPLVDSESASSVLFLRTPPAPLKPRDDRLIELPLIPFPHLSKCAPSSGRSGVVCLQLVSVEAIDYLAHEVSHVVVPNSRHLGPQETSTIRVDHQDIGVVPSMDHGLIEHRLVSLPHRGEPRIHHRHEVEFTPTNGMP